MNKLAAIIIAEGKSGLEKWRLENLEQEIDLKYEEFVNLDLQGANLQGANLQGANLQGANLQEANLQGANIDLANFSEANLMHSNLQYIKMSSHFLNARRSSVSSWEHKGLSQIKTLENNYVIFKNADLRFADLTGSVFYFSDFKGSKLEHVEYGNTFIFNSAFDDDELDKLKHNKNVFLVREVGKFDVFILSFIRILSFLSIIFPIAYIVYTFIYCHCVEVPSTFFLFLSSGVLGFLLLRHDSTKKEELFR